MEDKLRIAVAAGIREMRNRVEDLRWCNKEDQCSIKSEGAQLALDDFEWTLAEFGVMIPEDEIETKGRYGVGPSTANSH